MRNTCKISFYCFLDISEGRGSFAEESTRELLWLPWPLYELEREIQTYQLRSALPDSFRTVDQILKRINVDNLTDMASSASGPRFFTNSASSAL
jgi:hypothetical protein